jgi:hypothetical protein
MMKLSQNCSFRFLKDDVKIYALCKKPKHSNTLIADEQVTKHLIMNPLRYTYYSEPVVNREGDVKNKLIAFCSQDLCYVWRTQFKFNQGKQDTLTSSFDTVVDNSFDNDVSNVELTLQDAKAVSEDLRMSLVVVLDTKDIDGLKHYEVFFYDAKNKQLNF